MVAQFLGLSYSQKISQNYQSTLRKILKCRDVRDWGQNVWITHCLTVLSILQRHWVGRRLERQFLKLTSHCLTLRARDQAWRPGDFHAARTWLLPFLWVQRCHGDGETSSKNRTLIAWWLRKKVITFRQLLRIKWNGSFKAQSVILKCFLAQTKL